MSEVDKLTLINTIIDIEYAMFDKVESLGGRADCQDDKHSFYIMRCSQHNAFSKKTLESYLSDLNKALSEGRNLVRDKYAYMMEYTDRLYYDEVLKGNLPECSKEKLTLIGEILNLLEEDYDKFALEFPYVTSRMRKNESKESMATISVYSFGELKTYSYETLLLYKKDVLEAKKDMSIVKRIQTQTAVFYGYKNLEETETALRQRG